jgi:monoamine oxidase
MARTPLLRALRKLAADHRAADALGLPPAELRGQREETLTRRELVKRAGIAGAAVTVGGAGAFAQRAAAAPSSAAPRIAIVGGGIAGLTAALTLADRG